MTQNNDFEIWYSILKEFEGKIANRSKAQDAGGLTNRGLTFGTYSDKSMNIFKDYEIAPTKERFLALRDTDIHLIAYKYYWQRFKIDTIPTTFKRVLYAECIWGGGASASLGFKSRDEYAKADTEPKELIARRLEYLKKVPSYTFNKNGWVRRMNGLLTHTSQNFEIQKTKKISEGKLDYDYFITIPIIALLLGLFFISK